MAYVAPVRTVAALMQGYGSGTNSPFQSLNVTIAAASTTTTNLPAAGTLTFNNAAVTLSNGLIRARFSNVAATPTLALVITATDGTLTTTLFTAPATPGLTTTSVVEYVIDFMSELNLNKFTFAATTVGAGGTMTADYEVAGNP